MRAPILSTLLRTLRVAQIAFLTAISFFTTSVDARVPYRFLPRCVSHSRPGRENQNSERVSETLPSSARIFFESNRTGRYGIYSMSIDAKDMKPFVVLPDCDCLYIDASPDGSQFVYARSSSPQRFAASDIWISDATGSQHRKLVENGTFPTFSGDGKTVYFERERKRVMAVSLADQEPREIFPGMHTSFDGYQISKPRLSADGRHLFFISDRGGRWNVWGVDLISRTVRHVGRGCEPAPNSDGSKVTWVANRWFRGKTFLLEKDMRSGAVSWLTSPPNEPTNDYFPSFSSDFKHLLFCNAPDTKAADSDLKYQICVLDAESGNWKQLTNDNYVNRWPKLLPA